MTNITSLLPILLLIIAPTLGIANHYTGGLRFMRSPDLIVENQDLTIGVDQISSVYTMVNTSNKNIIETIVLPQAMQITVNDQIVELKNTQRAISNDGHDVSNILKSLGLPFDPIKAMHTMDISANREILRNKLIELKLLEKKDETAEWQAKTFYYWQQEFPASSQTIIKQNYKPNVSTKSVKIKANNGLLYIPVTMLKKFWNLAINWSFDDPVTAANLQDKLEKHNPHIQAYCPSLKDYQAIINSQTKHGANRNSMETKELSYSFRSEDIWSQPINHFNLRINIPDNMHPILCRSGEFKQQGKNSLVFEAQNFVPLQDISVLFVEK